MRTSRRVNDALPSGNRQNEDTKTLIDWVSSFYGMFWGVWLGFYVEQIGRLQLNSIIPVELSPFILVGFAIIIMIFSYNFIKWLWKMRNDSPSSRAARAFFNLNSGVVLFIIVIFAIILIGWVYTVPIIWVGMGLWTSFGWPIIVTAVVYNRRGWNV